MRNQTSDRGTWNGSRSRKREAAVVPAAAATAYQLGKQLEAGSTGEVFEAAHPSLPGRYVVKVLRAGLAQSSQAVETFRQELAIISALRHPHIVQVIEVGVLPQDGRPFVVMERLEGGPLESRLGDGRPMPPEQVVALIKGVAGGLLAAHTRGVVHRELHPGNVFLAVAEGHEHGFPKILNFGVARLRNASGGDVGVGAEEARYMAPEQAQGRAQEIDGRTDQFALAALAYRMLSGADAFRGSDPIAVLYQVVHEAPEPIDAYTAVDPRVEQVVLRGLSKRQSDRFESVLEFARALEGAATANPVVATAKPVAATAKPVVATAKPMDDRRPGRTRLGHDDEPGDDARRSPPAARASAMALPGGGVLEDQFHWHTEADDLDDDDLDRVPHHRWRMAAFLVGFALVSLAAALWAGWQPPLAWRQSQLWHTLHLPRAAHPTLAVPEQPAPVPATAAPPPSSTATAAGEVPPPPPSAPAPAGAAPALPAEKPVPTPAASPPATDQPAMPRAAADPAKAPTGKERRSRPRQTRTNSYLEGVVWSEREQRLVPVNSPAAHAPPEARPSAPPEARPSAPPERRPSAAPLSGDAPLPLSPP